MKCEMYHGDCLQVMRELPDHSVDFILTDPPYGTTACAWDKLVNLDEMWAQLNRIAKPSAAVCVFAQLPFAVDVINANRKRYHYEWIWRKTMATGFLNANKMPRRAHENILVFFNRLPTYHPQKTAGEPYIKKKKNHKDYGGVYKDVYCDYDLINTGQRYPTDVITFSNGTWGHYLTDVDGSRIKHATAKPVPLCGYLIETYTNKGDTVLDCFSGSASTGVAALCTERNYIGIELDATYFRASCKRLTECTLGVEMKTYTRLGSLATTGTSHNTHVDGPQ